jgi:hypothetical protein
VIEARLVDTILGCAVDLVGGFCQQSPRFRDVICSQLRRLMPSLLAL